MVVNIVQVVACMEEQFHQLVISLAYKLKEMIY